MAPPVTPQARTTNHELHALKCSGRLSGCAVCSFGFGLCRWGLTQRGMPMWSPRHGHPGGLPLAERHTASGQPRRPLRLHAHRHHGSSAAGGAAVRGARKGRVRRRALSDPDSVTVRSLREVSAEPPRRRLANTGSATGLLPNHRIPPSPRRRSNYSSSSRLMLLGSWWGAVVSSWSQLLISGFAVRFRAGPLSDSRT